MEVSLGGEVEEEEEEIGASAEEEVEGLRVSAERLTDLLVEDGSVEDEATAPAVPDGEMLRAIYPKRPSA